MVKLHIKSKGQTYWQSSAWLSSGDITRPDSSSVFSLERRLWSALILLWTLLSKAAAQFFDSMASNTPLAPFGVHQGRRAQFICVTLN